MALRYDSLKRGENHWKAIELTRPLPKTAWDRKWRVVIFDIPDRMKKTRDTLRTVLRQLGFVQLQESVWVTPFQCRDHVQAMKQLLRLEGCLKLITADYIDDDTALRLHFDLKDRP